MNIKTTDDSQHELSKESFDAALLPGVRDKMADAYRTLRLDEDSVLQSVLDSEGAFLEGVAHDRNCPLCGTDSSSALLMYYTHGMHIVQCGECGFVYSREVINQEADSARYRNSNVMNAHMALHKNSVYSELEKNKARYIIGQLRQRYGECNVNLLDIGCSTGAILEAGNEAGWRCLGIDLNSYAVNIARTSGLNAIEGSFPDDLAKDSGNFEVITMLDVLEHVEDPVNLFESVIERLSPKGLLAIQVPNFNSLLIRIEGAKNNNLCHGHWSYFTDDSLCKVAAQVGLQPLMIETFISEIDRILAYPESRIVEVAKLLSNVEVDVNQIDHKWIHKNLLGYKLFGIFARA